MRTLIIVDMLNEFVTGKLGTPEVRAIVPNCVKLLKAFRDADLPVAWVCDAHLPGDPEMRVWGEHAMYQSSEACLIPELNIDTVREIRDLKERTFNKFEYNGLSGNATGAANWIRSHESDTVVLCGTATNICVQHTACGAFTSGFNVEVVENATSAIVPPYLNQEEWIVRGEALDLYGMGLWREDN